MAIKIYVILGDVVESHLTSLIDDFTEVPDKLRYTLIFKAENLPALGYRVYKIKRLSRVNEEKDVPNVGNVDQMGFEVQLS